MSEKSSIATGADLNADTWADFVKRLHHDCVGEGVSDHCTADAIFKVQARRYVFGIDRDYASRTVVIVDDDHWEDPAVYYGQLDQEEKDNIDKLAIEEFDCPFIEVAAYNQWSILEGLPYHTVTGMDERWEHVNSHFTKDAAEAFIRRKKHDYPAGLRVYVDAQLYCWEFNTIKEAILSGSLVFVEKKGEAV